MANKVRFTDQLTVNSFGNVMPEAIVTASGGVGNIVFTKANGSQITLPLAASASNATALITASASENVITFTFGDLSTFDVTVATGSGGGGSIDTGSLLITGSVSGNVLTFTKGDGTSFTMTVDTGSSLPSGVISSSNQISELGFVTSSATASFITNSQTSSMSVLSAQTASYVLNAVSSSFSSFAVSASYAVSSSHEIIKEISSSHANFADTASKSLDNVLTASVSSNIITFTKGDNTTFSLTVDTGSGEPLPSGTVSSSTQISELGFVTSSATASFITNSQTSSMSVATASFVQNAISSSFAVSASYAVSASHEIIKEISSSYADTASYVENAQSASFVTTAQTASFVENAQTASFVTTAQTASYVATASYTPTFQQVTNQGATTTNSIQITGSGANSTLILSGSTGNDLEVSNNVFIKGTTTLEGDNKTSPYLKIINSASNANKDQIGIEFQVRNPYASNPKPLEIIGQLKAEDPYNRNVILSALMSQSVGDPVTDIHGVQFSMRPRWNIFGSYTESIVEIGKIGGLSGNLVEFFNVKVSQSRFYKDVQIDEDLNVQRNITASGNISASGYISASEFVGLVTTAQTASYVTSSNIVGNFTTSSIINFPTEVSRSAAAAGFGAGGESIPSGTVSSSAQITELGFVQSSITASSLDTASVSNNTITFTKGNGDTFDITVNTGSGTSIDTGSFITNSQTSSMTVGTASIANFIPFNGNRSVSNQNQPLNIRNVNFGANGLADFINKVYFTNDGPVLDAQNITIGEFLPIGSTVATITATDAEGQAITFGTSSTYTDDFFRINSSTGVVTLNAKSTSSMNTFNDGGTLKAPFPVTATDTFNESGSLTYYIRITPNTAPIWSENSGVGNVTDITESIAEDSGLGTDKDRYYFRDTEGDTITIGSGSFSTHFLTAFALTKQSGYVRLDQITSSLDFDLYPTYSFVLTASDEHYESGDDPFSITYLPVRINVTDNVAPSINPQTLTGVNEKSNTGASAGTVAASDAESNTITYAQFILKSAFLNSAPSINLTSSLGGASLQNPSSNPFSINPSTGQVTRKSGQFLNVDIADRYVYTTTVRDNFNPVSASADITIPIANHVANTISISSVANIIETATTGNKVNQASTGLGGSNTILLAANSSIQRWTITSTPDLIEATNITASSTTLQLKSNLSGSATVGGNTITLQITASQDDFDTTIQYLDKVVDVELMAAPILSPSDQTSNLNTNGARPSNNLVLVSITDPQSFTIDHSTWTFTPNSGQALEAVRNGAANSYYVRPTSNLAAGTYGYTASIFNDKGFRAGELKDEFTIAQAPVGSLTTNGTFYIIESALTNNPVVLDDDGRTGTQGDLGVTYSPTYNSAAVSSFASSNAAIAVASNGNLTAGENISGSSNTYPGTITSNITWQDQYGNAGGPTAITVIIAENTAPSATITKVSPTLEAPQNSGTKLADVSISDTEGDTPFNLSLTGTDAASLVAFPTNANSSSYEIRLAGNENAAASFTYNAVVKDNFGSTQTLSNQTLSIDSVPVFWYAYLPEVGAYATDVASCLSSYGDANDDGTLDTNMPFYDIANGNLGDTTITSSGLTGVSAEFSFLVASGSAITASRTNLFLDGIDQTVGQQGFTGLIIVFPSGSSGFLQPESMGVTLGDSTSGRYLMFGDMPGTGINDNPRTSAVRYFDFIGGNQYPNSSETRFGTIFLPGESTSNIDYFLMSASGSAPASQQ